MAGLETPRAAVRLIDRVWLVVLALCAELAFALAALLFALPMGIPAFLYAGAWGYLALVVIWVVCWLWLQPDSHSDSETDVVPGDAPIFGAIEDLRQKIQAPRIHRVVLDDSLNAAARTDAWLGIFFPKRTLILGVPLLMALSKAEVLAVIAHELGHFSRQHGRLAHWVYRVRWKWGPMAVAVPDPEADDSIQNTLQHFAQSFLPYFINKSATWSRACELEADAAAARATSAQALISGLTKLAAFDEWHAQDGQRVHITHALRDTTAPSDSWGDTLHAFNHEKPDVWVDRALQREQRLGVAAYDSHPSASARAQALGIDPRAEPSPPADAGQALLGRHWQALQAASAKRLQRSSEASWPIYAGQLQVLNHTMQSAAPYKLSGVLANDEDLAPLLAAQTLGRDVSDRLTEPEPIDTQTLSAERLLAMGANALSQQHPRALAWLKEAIKKDDRLGPTGATWILNEVLRQGDGRELELAKRRVEHYQQLEQKTYAAGVERLLSTASWNDLPEPLFQILAGGFEAHTAIDAAWAAQVPIAGVFKAPVTLGYLLVRADPKLLAAIGMSDESIWQRTLRDSLRLTQAPTQFWLIQTVYTTEPIALNRLAVFENKASRTLKRPRVPVNDNIVMVDSL
jgi:Zn-dependent protease with chaperone function